MYYPIIDKLKDVMEEIGQGGASAYVFDGTRSSNLTSGTWTGDFSRILSDLENGLFPVLRLHVGNTTILYQIYSGRSTDANGLSTSFDLSYVQVKPNGTLVFDYPL